MKLRILLVAALAAGLTASAAIASPPPDKGKPNTTGDGCKPMVTVVLKGTIAQPSSNSVVVNVTRSNRWGRAYVVATQPTTVSVDAKTKLRLNGNKKTLTDLDTDYRVLVQARACKADLAEGATPVLTAARIVAHPKKTKA